MIVSYIEPNSDEAVLNSFADYILKNLKGTSNIQITNHKNFLVINGKTTSKEVINLVELKHKFFEEKYSDSDIKKSFNIIDIIRYNVSVFDSKVYHFTYYNSKRPIYHPEVIKFVENPGIFSGYQTKLLYNQKLIFEIGSEDSLRGDHYQYNNYLSSTSTFPSGVNTTHRTAFYYGEYICNHLFSYLNVDEIHLKIDMNKNSETDDYDIKLFCDSIYDEDKINSLVLDVFDFNLDKFKSEYLKGYDYDLDTTDPLGKKPWLVKDKIKDILIF